MLTAANVTVRFDHKTLFENVNAKFGNGNRYGLIGANGAGKSTLMKVFSGKIVPSSGSISIGPGERLGILGQDQFAFEGEKVIDTVMMSHQELYAIHKERERIYSLPDMTEEDGIKVADLEVRYAELDGYSAEARAGELLLGLEIPESYHQGFMSAVPPTLKLRILLAQVLFSEPQILLLDEPTNNLDMNTIRWLETILNDSKATMVIISHDRHFLNSVCTHIADLDYGDLKIYPGNYDNFMIASLQKREQMMADNEKKKTQIEELQAFVRRFSANASKARQATSRAKQIEKIELDDIRPSSRKSPYIRFVQEKKLFRQALEIKNLTKGFGEEPLFKNVNFSVDAGEKIAIIGATGVGKTTMLRCLVGNLSSDDPKTVIKFAEQASIGYFAQDHSDLFQSNETLYDFLYGYKKPSDDEQSIRGALGRMLFTGEDSKKALRSLSGGEQARLLFARFTIELPNVLVLDEPTNHLDMESIEALNTALEKYEGTLIFVSHDREFVSSIASRIIEVTPKKVIDYKGNYEHYLEKQEELEKRKK